MATLGAEPQVIAIASQLLQQSGIELRSVIVLHTQTDQPPLSIALPALEKAFAEQPSWPPLRPHPLPMDDVLTPEELEIFGNRLFAVLKEQIQQGNCIHLLLAGGRKPMAMIGTTIAQMLLGPTDRLWYLHSDEALRQSRRFELEREDQAQLIAIDLPQLSPSPPIYTPTIQAENAASAQKHLSQERQRRLSNFVEKKLTPAEREVAALVAQELLTVKAIAARLHKSPKTVTNQLNSVYSKLESWFGLQPDVGLKREFLRKELGGYFHRG